MYDMVHHLQMTSIEQYQQALGVDRGLISLLRVESFSLVRSEGSRRRISSSDSNQYGE